MKSRICLFAVALIYSSVAAAADDWFTPTRVQVREGILLQRDYSAVTMTNAKNGDVQIRVATSQNGKATSGEMFVVGGHILLTKDVDLSPGAEIDAIDAPVLQVQLALKLLRKALPVGPSGVREPKTLNVSEDKEPLEVSTSSASGEYQPPWSVRGSVSRDKSNRIAFTLTFESKSISQPVTIAGTWERTEPAPTFSDSLPVAGYRAFQLGPYSKQDSNGTIFDYGSQELPQTFKTLGEARAAAKKRAA